MYVIVIYMVCGITNTKYSLRIIRETMVSLISIFVTTEVIGL